MLIVVRYVFQVETEKVTFSTSSKDQVKDLTSEVKQKVEQIEIKNGMCLIFAPHATGMIILNENERGIRKDYMKGIYNIVPENNNYEHDRIDNNAHAHIKSAFVGTDKTVPVSDGNLDLGTWQNIFFLETDGPRSQRRLILKVMGESVE